MAWLLWWQTLHALDGSVRRMLPSEQQCESDKKSSKENEAPAVIT